MKFLRQAVEGVRKWVLKKLVGDYRIITDIYEGYVLETFKNSGISLSLTLWVLSVRRFMETLKKKIFEEL